MKRLSFSVYNRKHYHWQIPLLISLVFLLVSLFVKDAFSFSNFILLVTFFAILWYSFEARELKNVTQKQLEPILFLYSDRRDGKILLTNVGKSPASNIHIDPIVIGRFCFEFNILRPVYYILAGETLGVQITVSKELTRTFDFSVKDVAYAMKNENIEKIDLILQYDTSFQVRKTTNLIFDISEWMQNEKDPIRMYKIYPAV